MKRKTICTGDQNCDEGSVKNCRIFSIPISPSGSPKYEEYSIAEPICHPENAGGGATYSQLCGTSIVIGKTCY